jgi:predicted nucleic acid-binding Zn ribbon protein
MVCIACGKRISDDSAFCSRCGQSLAQKRVDDIATGPLLTFARLVGFVAGRATRHFLNAGPKLWWAAAILLLFVGIIGITHFNSGQQQRTTEKISAEREKVPEAASNLPKVQSPADVPSTSSAVQGFAANELLADQLEKHQRTMDALTDARDRGDINAVIRILRLRSRELAQAIDDVNAGSYSINDKQQMLNTLKEEKDWASDGAAALSQ